MQSASVRRVDFGWFCRPAVETGTGRDQVEPCLGYLIEHPAGLLLLDTGMGSHPEVDEHYRPHRVPLPEALRRAGSRLDQVTEVVNCHLHFDHCGGNPLLAGRPVLTQRSELATARTTSDYTLPELIDPPGAHWVELDGEAEIAPGVHVLPTPGHTGGHQSVIVRTGDGTVVVAGQSHDTATAFGRDALAGRAGVASVPLPPAWMARLLALDPARVVFAHDHAVWVP